MNKLSLLLLMVIAVLLHGCSLTSPTSPAAPDEDRIIESQYLLKEEIKYDSSGSPHYKNVYTYDNEGRLISRDFIRYAYEDADEYSYTENFSYNEKGHLISSVTTDWAGVSNYYEYTYNQDGSVSSYSIKNEKQEVTGTHYFEYDTSGRFVRKYYRDKNGAEQNIFSCEYDAVGRIVKCDNRPGQATYSYDQQGRMVKCFADGFVEYQYDGDLMISESRSTGDMKWTYSYVDGRLNAITMDTSMAADYGEFAKRKYEINEQGLIDVVRYDNGGWIEYSYEKVNSTEGRRYWNTLNEPLGLESAYQDVKAFVLPRPDLDA